jgi:hypothetical protein
MGRPEVNRKINFETSEHKNRLGEPKPCGR